MGAASYTHTTPTTPHKIMELQKTLSEIFPGLRVSESVNDDGSVITIAGWLGNSQVFTLWASKKQVDGTWIFIPQVLNEQPGVMPNAQVAITWIRSKLRDMRPRQTIGWHGVGQERPAGFGRPKWWRAPGVTRPIRVPEVIADKVIDLLCEIDDPDAAIATSKLSYLMECLGDY